MKSHWEKNIRKYLAKADFFANKYTLLRSVAFVFLILMLTHKIYFKQYYLPNVAYWDEVYHIPSAAKYIQGVHFMEPHPPLGKILMAWGELLINKGEMLYGWNANHSRTFGLEGTMASGPFMPKDFTFAGYRLFPALAGWLNALLFSLILLQLLGSRVWALLFLPLYAFDNALIAHSRGAMLDSLMLFGIFLCLWGFLKILNFQKEPARVWIWPLFIMSFGFAFAVTTKVLALIFVLLWPILFWLKRHNKNHLAVLWKGSLFQGLVFSLFFCGVWNYHFENSRRIIPRFINSGTFQASSDYEKILLGLPNDLGLIEKFYVQLRDNINFFRTYETTIAGYDLEKGHLSASHPLSWPFGIRPLYYRNTPASEVPARHLIMIPNPVIWYLGLSGIILSLGALVMSFFSTKYRPFSPRTTQLLKVFLTFYFLYMFSVLMIKRSLYLNHYFIPLILSFFIVALMIKDTYTHSKEIPIRKGISIFLGCFPVLALAFFLYLKPFTYYEPLTCEEGANRSLFHFWNIKLNFCPDPFAAPGYNVGPYNKPFAAGPVKDL